MITRENIERIYASYPHRPESIDMLDLALLFDNASEYHGVYIDPDSRQLIISSIDAQSPFHAIPLNVIHAIIPFEEWLAVVLGASIIFLNRTSSETAIDIRSDDTGILSSLRRLLRH